MSKKILTEEQEEQILLTNPEILKLVRRAIRRVYERLQDFEDEYSQVQLSAEKLAEIINDIELEFLQEKTSQ